MQFGDADSVTLEQALEALSALGTSVLADPEYRPDGPTTEDLPELLGGLLGKVEGEVMKIMKSADFLPSHLWKIQRGWQYEADYPEVCKLFIINRLIHVNIDLMSAVYESEADEAKIRGASAAIKAAIDLVNTSLRGECSPTGQFLENAESHLSKAHAHIRYARSLLPPDDC
ncbi:hypothetical protein ABZ769_35565 [Streptomyces olivoreticuli]